MAAEELTLRDGNDTVRQPLPPGDKQSELDHKTPVHSAGSFLVTSNVDMAYAGDPPYTFSTLVDPRRRMRLIRYKRHGDLSGLPDLPPRDAWLIGINDRFETPVDERGLVKQDELVDMVYSFIDPSFRWPRELSVDHVYHDEEWYYSSWAPECGGRFRELTIHKMLVRRMWENLKHKVVIPAAVPSEEVMRQRLESWEIASSLLHSIRNTERVKYFALRRLISRGGLPEDLNEEFDGLDPIAREWALDAFKRHKRATDKSLERLDAVAPEFRLVDPSAPRDVIAERLAKVAGAEALHMVRRPAA